MTLTEGAFIVAGAAAGGFINGLAGFGTALFALGFFLSVLPPTQAVALVVLLSVVTGLQGLWVVRAAIYDQLRRLARFLLPAIVGVPIGVALLRFVDVGVLKLVIAGFLMLYGGFFTARRTLPKITRATPRIDSAVGFAGGVLGGLAGLSGALPTMWCSMRDWPKAETRAVLQPFNVGVLALSALVLGLRGGYTGQTLTFALLAIPTSLICAQGGIALFRRLPDAAFRRLLIALCFVSGAVLLVREVL